SSPPMGDGHSLARKVWASARASPVGAIVILLTGRRGVLGSFPPHAASRPRATQANTPRPGRRKALDMGGLWGNRLQSYHRPTTFTTGFTTTRQPMPRTISLKTAIPGPASQALLARRAKAVPRGVPAVTSIAIAHAEGAVLTDVDGNRLIDFGGGIGVVNVGHRHPAVLDAVREQLDRYLHVCFPVSSYEPYIALAER